MSWVRFDDQMNNHPKVLAAGPLADLLNRRAIVYCGQYLTDGKLQCNAVTHLIDWTHSGVYIVSPCNGVTSPLLTPSVTASVTPPVAGAVSGGERLDGMEQPDNLKLADELVRVGLWERDGDCFIIHDFLQYNPSRAEVLRERDKSKSRVARHRAKPCNAVTTPLLRANNDVTSGAPFPLPIPRECKGDGFSDNDELTRAQVEQVGFPRFGTLAGETGIKVARLCPIRAWEMRDALRANIHAWGGFVSVISRIRDEAAKPKPPQGKDRASGADDWQRPYHEKFEFADEAET